jgi:hypothetical protein
MENNDGKEQVYIEPQAPDIPKGDIRNWLFGVTRTASNQQQTPITSNPTRHEINNSKGQPPMESLTPPKTPPPRPPTQQKQSSATQENAPHCLFISPLNVNPNNLFISGVKEQQSIARPPPNTCAFVSAINMLAQGTWKQEMVVKAEEWGKRLVIAVKGVATTEADMAEAIQELAELDDNQYLQPISEYQDPFVVLQLAMKMLEAMRKDEKTKPLYPIWGCDCGREGATLV